MICDPVSPTPAAVPGTVTSLPHEPARDALLQLGVNADTLDVICGSCGTRNTGFYGRALTCIRCNHDFGPALIEAWTPAAEETDAAAVTEPQDGGGAA